MRRFVVRRKAIGRLAILAICLALLIFSFAFKRNDSKQLDSDASFYAGRWYGADHHNEICRGIKYEVGTAIQLVLTKDDQRVIILYKSPPPINDIAHIGAKLEQGPEHTATFRFDDDDWGNAGQGSISFGKGHIRIRIKLNKEPTSKFWMFQGVKILSKAEPEE